jgi:hypothetical protein
VTVPLLFATESWHCPLCRFEETIPRIAGPHTRMHICPKLNGLTTPLVAAGVKAKVERRDPEDYVGGSLLTFDDTGRPVQSVVTTRDEGQDCAVYPPTATAFGTVNEIKEELRL